MNAPACCDPGRTCPVPCEEAARVAADLRINELKNTGELRRRDDERALRLQLDDVTRWPD